MDANTATVVTALIAGLPAIIVAAASFYKAWKGGKEIVALQKQVTKQAERIECLEKENNELKDENKELREQNTILAGINEEYRTRLLSEIGKRNR